MRVCVISPYYKENRDSLERCMQSVVMQTHPCSHMLVSDGFPQDFIDERSVRHVRLGASHRDYGDTPRGIGAMLAAAEGFDAIAFLDADNCYLPNHIAQLVAAAEQSQADVVTSWRALFRPDLTYLPVPDDMDEGQTAFVDMNCYLFRRAAFGFVQRNLLMRPRELSIIDDRILWLGLQASGLKIHRTQAKSICYITMWSSHYKLAGETPPADAKSLPWHELQNWWKAMTSVQKEQVHRGLGFSFAIN